MLRRRALALTLVPLVPLYFVLYAAGLTMTKRHASILDGALALIVLIATTVYLWIALRHDASLERHWRWVALGAACFTGSDIWTLMAKGVRVRFMAAIPDVGQVLWSLGIASMLVGVVLLMHHWMPHAGRGRVIDGTIVALGLFTLELLTLSWALDGVSTLGPSLLLSIVRLLCDAGIVATCVGAAQSVSWRPPRAVWFILTAGFVFGAADLLFAIENARGASWAPRVAGIGWSSVAVLVCLAAASRRGRGAPAPAVRAAHTMLPAGMIIVAALSLLLTIPGPLTELVRAMGLATLLFALFRLDGAVRWSAALARELQIARADPLTGLPNRRAMHSLSPSSLDSSVTLVIDIDGFGEINARYGSAVGDEVLIQVAGRIRAGVREGDFVARVGADAFGVVLHGITAERAVSVAEGLLADVEAEIDIQSVTVQVSACIGVSSRAGHSADPAHMLAEADAALGEVKALGTGLVRTFAGSTGERSQERLRLRAEIRDAFRSGGQEFVPYLHPITRVHDGHLFAVEALVRWHHAGRVWSPAEFLSEIESSGNMRQLTQHMLFTSLESMRRAGLAVPVTVNVPPSLVDPALPGMIRAALERSKSQPHQLVVEITEDAIMQSPRIAGEVLRELRLMGVRVLLDDFGTGWSGLSLLRDFVVDGLKVDGSFMREFLNDYPTETIVRSVTELAERLGMLVIYEGVEDPALLAEVDGFRHGYVQGFAVARPMPVEDLVQWTATRAGTASSGPRGDGEASVPSLR